MYNDRFVLGMDRATVLGDISSVLVDRIIEPPSNYTKRDWEYTCISLQKYTDRYDLVLANVLQCIHDGVIDFQLSASSPSHHIPITKEEYDTIRNHIDWIEEVDMTKAAIVMID